ncbi:MAG: hypothetical protein V1796_04045 [Pseudomonadota bacterium]
MKSFMAICCSLIAAVAASAAVAGPFEQGMRFQPFVQTQTPRREPQRDAARPEPQRDVREPGEADRGRMSPDERHQLRRDIQDAGKDIYHRDRPAPRREQRR